MTLVFPQGYRYDCGSCTKCCRTVWNVHVSPRAYERITGTPLFERMRAEHGRDPVYMDEVRGEKTALALVKAGGCIFLGPDRLCAVHRELGVDAKPLGCREFPFLPVPTPDGVYVGLSFYCSAVQAGDGRPIEAHAVDIEGMLGEYRYERVGFEPIALDASRRISWTAYKALESFAADRLADDLATAGWDVACAVARACRDLALSDDGTVDDEAFAGVLARHERVVMDDVLVRLEKMFVEGVAGVLESDSPATCRANTEAIFRRGVVRSASFGGDLDLAGFDGFADRATREGDHSEMRRYFDHLLFRKFLALKRPLAHNAAAFYLVGPLLSWYRDLSAYAAGRSAPNIDDTRKALDIIERGFVMHARNMDPFFSQLADTLAQLV